MKGREGKTGDPARAEQEPPHPAGPQPCPLQGALPFKVLVRIPQLPQGKGLVGRGAGTGPAAGGRDIDHSSLHSWRSQVAARTIFSSPGGGRGAAGRDEIELVGGEREESMGIRTSSCPVHASRVGVRGSGLLQVSQGAVRSTGQTLFPSRPEPLLRCPAQPPTPQSGPVCCADLTSAKSGDSRGH